jgi:hypothetical protein
MTAQERLQLLVGGLDEEQAERALELLSPLIGADARPGQQVRRLPAFVGIGDSGQTTFPNMSMTCSQAASPSSLTFRGPCGHERPLRSRRPQGQASRAVRGLAPAHV